MQRWVSRLGVFLLLLLGLMALFADFFSLHPPTARVVEELVSLLFLDGNQWTLKQLPPDHRKDRPSSLAVPPSRLHLFDERGTLHWPYFCRWRWRQILIGGGWQIEEDCSNRYPLLLFVRNPSYPYRILGLFETDFHLFGTADIQAPLFLLGTDGEGRDLLSRLLAGSRVSLGISGLATLLALLLALPLGVCSGYFGGRTDLIIQGIVEGTLTFPRLALILVLASAVREAEARLVGMVLLLALAGFAPIARMLRAQVLALREEGFLEAARALGADHGHIMLRHLFPHLVGTILVSATLALPNLLMLESFLSYLGYGVPETLVSWGSILQEAGEVHLLPDRPWLLGAGGAIVLTTLACTLVGETLQERFNPFRDISRR